MQIILGQKISFAGSPHKHCLIKMALEHIYLIAIGWNRVREYNQDLGEFPDLHPHCLLLLLELRNHLSAWNAYFCLSGWPYFVTQFLCGKRTWAEVVCEVLNIMLYPKNVRSKTWGQSVADRAVSLLFFLSYEIIHLILVYYRLTFSQSNEFDSFIYMQTFNCINLADGFIQMLKQSNSDQT